MRIKSTIVAVSAAALLLLMPACKTGDQQSTEKTDSGAANQQAAQKARPQAPERVTVTVPEGTTLSVRLADTLDTGKLAAGASFQGTLAQALVANGKEVAPVGSTVAGTVSQVVSSGRLNRPAELALTLTSLTAGRETKGISTSTWSQKGESHKKRDAVAIGGGGGVGALIGGLVGGKKGAAIGGAVGAGAGAGGAAYTGKKEIVLPAETALEFQLAAPVSFTLRR